MKILVTGGAGYVGSALSIFLAKSGDEVTVLDRMVFGCRLPIDRPGLRILTGDVRDVAQLSLAMKGQEAVVHLAFASNDPDYRLDPRVAADLNLAPMQPLLRCAFEHGVRRFVFLSSCSVYGRAEGAMLDEDSPRLPLTQYAQHKSLCEDTIREFERASGLSCTVLRPATVCGPSARQRLDLLLNRMLAQAAIDQTIHVSGGSSLRPSIAIDDLVRAIRHVLALSESQAAQTTFNVCSQTLTVAEWARLIAALTGCRVLEAEDAAPKDLRSYRVSDARLRATGFSVSGSVTPSLLALWQQLSTGYLAGRGSEEIFYNLPMQIKHDFSVAVYPKMAYE